MTTPRKYKNFISPVMTARYPKLSQPDTKGEFADGKYKTDGIAVSDADHKAFAQLLQQTVKEFLPGVKAPKLPIKTDEASGENYFKFKSVKKPRLVDAKRNLIPEHVNIGGGSKIKIAGVISNYDKGLSLYIDAVQVLELSERGGNPIEMFGVEDGFTAEDVAVAPSVDAVEAGDDAAPADAFNL